MRRELDELQFFSQNVCGLAEPKLDELLVFMREKKIFAYAIQETWRKESGTFEKDGFVIVSHGTGKKGHGVAIVMSKAAVRAWKAAGQYYKTFGSRVIAVNFKFETGSRN